MIQIRSVILTVVFALVALGSVYFVVADNPEDRVITSADGVVTLTGVTRSTQPFVITDGGVAASSVLTGQIYHVLPDAAVLAAPVVLTWRANDAGVSSVDQLVYNYNHDSLMWEAITTAVERNEQLLAVKVSTLGDFALGYGEDVTIPNYVDDFKNILTGRPANAVGFVTTVGYNRNAEPIVQLPTVGEQGGCGGAVWPGVSEQRSVVTREATLLVDDVQTPLTLTFFTRWFIGTGCPVASPFMSAKNYGILPSV